MTTIFSQIIEGKIPSEKVFENEYVVAFKDIHPIAPIHILITTRKAIASLQELAPEDLPLMMEVVKAAQQIAKQFNIEEGYRLLTNNGSSAGQTIFHLHFHLIGGRSLGRMA